MPLIEITVAGDVLNKEERLRIAKAVQKAMLEEFKTIKGITPWSAVIVRETERETWLTTSSS
jgi:phenylpyruvate tautomerase PptA (4-oxalocrotonate tautomerase family)